MSSVGGVRAAAVAARPAAALPAVSLGHEAVGLGLGPLVRRYGSRPSVQTFSLRTQQLFSLADRHIIMLRSLVGIQSTHLMGNVQHAAARILLVAAFFAAITVCATPDLKLYPLGASTSSKVQRSHCIRQQEISALLQHHPCSSWVRYDAYVPTFGGLSSKDSVEQKLETVSAALAKARTWETNKRYSEEWCSSQRERLFCAVAFHKCSTQGTFELYPRFSLAERAARCYSSRIELGHMLDLEVDQEGELRPPIDLSLILQFAPPSSAALLVAGAYMQRSKVYMPEAPPKLISVLLKGRKLWTGLGVANAGGQSTEIDIVDVTNEHLPVVQSRNLRNAMYSPAAMRLVYYMSGANPPASDNENWKWQECSQQVFLMNGAQEDGDSMKFRWKNNLPKGSSARHYDIGMLPRRTLDSNLVDLVAESAMKRFPAQSKMSLWLLKHAVIPAIESHRSNSFESVFHLSTEVEIDELLHEDYYGTPAIYPSYEPVFQTPESYVELVWNLLAGLLNTQERIFEMHLVPVSKVIDLLIVIALEESPVGTSSRDFAPQTQDAIEAISQMSTTLMIQRVVRSLLATVDRSGLDESETSSNEYVMTASVEQRLVFRKVAELARKSFYLATNHIMVVDVDKIDESYIRVPQHRYVCQVKIADPPLSKILELSVEEVTFRGEFSVDSVSIACSLVSYKSLNNMFMSSSMYLAPFAQLFGRYATTSIREPSGFLLGLGKAGHLPTFDLSTWEKYFCGLESLLPTKGFDESYVISFVPPTAYVDEVRDAYVAMLSVNDDNRDADNYRHVAAVGELFKFLRNNGFPRESIVTMIPDNGKDSLRNMHPDLCKLNHIRGSWDCSGVLDSVDYYGDMVSPSVFMALIGMRNPIGEVSRMIEKMEGLKGRYDAINSPNGALVARRLRAERKSWNALVDMEQVPKWDFEREDSLLVYFSDHGAPGRFFFPLAELTKNELMEGLSVTKANVLFIADACHSGSMFTGMQYDSSLNHVVAITSQADVTNVHDIASTLTQAFLYERTLMNSLWNMAWLSTIVKMDLVHGTAGILKSLVEFKRKTLWNLPTSVYSTHVYPAQKENSLLLRPYFLYPTQTSKMVISRIARLGMFCGAVVSGCLESCVNVCDEHSESVDQMCLWVRADVQSQAGVLQSDEQDFICDELSYMPTSITTPNLKPDSYESFCEMLRLSSEAV